jgi:hypothetical protein
MAGRLSLQVADSQVVAELTGWRVALESGGKEGLHSDPERDAPRTILISHTRTPKETLLETESAVAY